MTVHEYPKAVGEHTATDAAHEREIREKYYPEPRPPEEDMPKRPKKAKE